MVFRQISGPAPRLRRTTLVVTLLVAALALVAGCVSIPGTPMAAYSATSAPVDPSGVVTDVTDDAVLSGPSSQELIAAALEAGEIDVPTSWLYRTWAAFADELLPKQFAGSDGGHDTELLTSLSTLMTDFPEDIKLQIEPYLVRPTDPRSIYNASDPPGLRSMADSALLDSAARDAARAPTTRDNKATAQCVDGWDTMEVPGAHMRVWGCKGLDSTGRGQTTSAMESLAQMLGAYVPKMVADMGALIPDDPTGDPDPRADSRIDVYLVPPTATGPSRGDGAMRAAGYGYARTTAPDTGKTASSFVVINLDALTDSTFAERTIVHEMFHVLQYTHNAPMESRWYYDASAEWAASYYVRHDSARLHQVRLPVLQNASSQYLQNSIGLPKYGAYLWPLLMEQEVGAKTVFATWPALGKLTGNGSDDDVIGVISNFLDVESSFPEFVMRMYNAALPGNPIEKRFRQLDGNFPDNLTPKRDALKLDDEPLEVQYDLGGTGWRYTPVEVTPPPGAEPDEEVYVQILGDVTRDQGGQPSLEALVRKRDGDYKREVINFAGNGTKVCVSKNLLLVMANPGPSASNTATGVIHLIRDEEPGCASIEVTHPQTRATLADSGDIVTVTGEEDDGKPDVMPLVVSVFDVPRDKVGDFTVEVELSGGTLADTRELNWPLTQFKEGPRDTFVYETSISLDYDLTKSNRPMTIDAKLFENGDEVDDHSPTAQLHGEEQDKCLIGAWKISAAEMENFYAAVQDQAKFQVRGSVGLTFTEDEYVYAPDLVMRMKISSDGFQISTDVETTGSITGTYRANGTILRTSNDKVDVSATMTVMGQTMDGSDILGSFINQSPINEAPYTCGSGGPILMFATGGPDRIPIHLRPAN